MSRDELIESIMRLQCEPSVRDALLVLATEPHSDNDHTWVLENRNRELEELLNTVRVQLDSDSLSKHEKAILSLLADYECPQIEGVQHKFKLSRQDLELAIGTLREREFIHVCSSVTGQRKSYAITLEGRRALQLIRALGEA